MDLGLNFDKDRMICDLSLKGGDLVTDRSTLPQLLVSLGSDSRAKKDDPLPGQPTAEAEVSDALPPDRRGWIGDALKAGPRLGCRLWLLWREKATETVRRRAEAYAKEGLDWAIAEGRSVSITSGWKGNTLILRVRLGKVTLDLPFKGASNAV